MPTENVRPTWISLLRAVREGGEPSMLAATAAISVFAHFASTTNEWRWYALVLLPVFTTMLFSGYARSRVEKEMQAILDRLLSRLSEDLRLLTDNEVRVTFFTLAGENSLRRLGSTLDDRASAKVGPVYVRRAGVADLALRDHRVVYVFNPDLEEGRRSAFTAAFPIEAGGKTSAVVVLDSNTAIKPKLLRAIAKRVYETAPLLAVTEQLSGARL